MTTHAFPRFRPFPALVAVAALVATTGLAGCGPSAKDKARKAEHDARDVAMVERMNEAPFRPLTPQPITPRDESQFGLALPDSCVFTPGLDGKARPLFIARRDEGVLKLDGDLKRLAAKTESAELAGGARTTYVGLDTWIDLVRQPDQGTGDSATHFAARLILHDAQDRVAFLSQGMISCDAAPAATSAASTGAAASPT